MGRPDLLILQRLLVRRPQTPLLVVIQSRHAGAAVRLLSTLAGLLLWLLRRNQRCNRQSRGERENPYD